MPSRPPPSSSTTSAWSNVETTRPLFLDPYVANRLTGSFILIDPVSHATVAAGMVREVLSGRQDTATVAAIAIRNPELLRLLETAFVEAGVPVVRTRTADRDLWQKLLQIGVVVLIEAEGQADFPGEISIAHDPAALVFEPLAGTKPSSTVLRALNRSNP